MKNIFKLLLICLSLNAFAAKEYSCDMAWYRIELTLDNESTHIWVWDKLSRNMVFQDYTRYIQKDGANTIYYFYPTIGHESKIYIKNSDLDNLPAKFTSFLDADFGQMAYDYLNCSER